MSVRDLYANITGTSTVLSVDITEGFRSFSSTCQVKCVNTTLDIGDDITVDLGYVGNHGLIFTGKVKKIMKQTPDEVYELTCFDTLIQASDYFMVSDDPNDPFTRTKIDATDLVDDLLNEAGISTLSADPTNFIFTEPTFNLVSVADAIGQINNILAYHLWSEEDGTIRFEDRRPYVMAGDSPDHTFTTGNSGDILTSDYKRSDDDLRNRVVIYGADPITATASAVSAYLPAGFYKTAVVASPLITKQSMADDAASFNLALYNRLTKVVTAEIEGDYSLHAHNIATVTESHSGVSGDWFVYSCSHAWGDTGYTTRMVLRD